uniref:Putative secreted protein n=1 Tax=Anopheles marajoara TaxID=58244 RepID=A0A2M4C7M4_9DIPT
MLLVRDFLLGDLPAVVSVYLLRTIGSGGEAQDLGLTRRSSDGVCVLLPLCFLAGSLTRCCSANLVCRICAPTNGLEQCTRQRTYFPAMHASIPTKQQTTTIELVGRFYPGTLWWGAVYK